MSTEEITTPAPGTLPPAPSTSHLLQSNVNKVLKTPKVPSDNSTQLPQSQQQQKQDNKKVVHQNLPCRVLLEEKSREDYLKIGVPLYEASIKCDWKAAKAILDKHEEPLVRYCITENGETALHVAASAKVPQKGEVFVKNLVDRMTEEDLALENENYNTALYLAAAAGNLETVKIMVKKNRDLLKIPGAQKQMLPLYAAALFGKYDVVKYLFKESNNLCDEDGWNHGNRGWLVEKCVENDMFDVALQIVEKYPKVGRGSVLQVLAGKPKAFPDTKTNIIGKAIKPVLTFIRSKLGYCEKENKALPLLRFVWNDIVKLPKKEIDRILRGQPDPIKQDNSASGRTVQVIQIQNLISEHLDKMLAISEDTIKGLSGSTKQDTKPVSGKEIDQAQQLQKLISAQLVSMHVATQKIIKGTPDSIALELEKVISGFFVKLNENTMDISKGTPDPLALELEKLISIQIVELNGNIQKIISRISDKKNQAQRIQRAIYDHVINMDKERKKIINKPAKDAYSKRVLFIAAETGNTNFLVELIRLYPDLIWKVNDNNQTIFHIAVKHRHEGIYNLLYEIGSMKDMITPLRDPNDNNMLHLVGTSDEDLEDASGVALRMQRELLWFEEVKQMIPPSYRERKNKDGLKPHELFTTKHKDLVTQSGQWMKDTASQCMVVAALIATIVFAAAFTIPGGYDGDSGLPMFQSKATLIVFVVADAISLFSSSASILIFLAILTSRYAERDFLESLPKKLMFGLATLFLSIATMTVVFAVSFFVLYHKGLLWIPILISAIAVIPVLLYVKLQYSLFIDVIRASYGSKYIFKPTKHVLYYETPKV
uniref:uncharacterized protein LOC122605342 n=1 Tax=Erigeron canadensis TaxID=72917 RepID=UPI001CB8C075|nr:uncharacterized protein LOC122605342 [Erigeron canadensis]